MMTPSFSQSLAAGVPLRFASSKLPAQLAIRLQRGPPGIEAQRRLEPELSFGRHGGPPSHDARAATVLVLLYPGQHGWELPLIVRPGTMLHHAGQVSLPGGAVDPGETSAQAALRELHEELGVSPDLVQMHGQLSPLYLYNSNYLVTPWVGSAADCPAWHPSSNEVAELLQVPLAQLADPSRFGRHRRSQHGVSATAPHIQWGRHRIWGATSMILAELLAAMEPGDTKELPS